MVAFKWGLFSRKSLLSIGSSDARYNLWEGAVRSSKTVSSLVRWIRYVGEEAPEGDLAMIGKTERTLYRNILTPLSAMVGGSRNFHYNRGTGEVALLGRRISVVGANDERAVEKIQGWTLAGAYGDELALWPESAFRMLGTRLSVPGAMFFGTLNPDSPYHYLKREYIDRAGELDLKAFHFELSDNPNLDPAYVEALKREYTGLWYKRFILGLWVQAEGAVYDMWRDERYPEGNLFTDGELPADIEWGAQRYISVDYGTTNPTVFGDWYDDGEVSWMLREYCWHSLARGRQKTDREYADDLEAFIADGPPVMAVIVDPSAASFKAELVQRGIIVRDAVNDVADGIRATATAIARRIVRVHERCDRLRAEIAGYVWDERARARGAEQPLKSHDHSLDQMRYYVATVLRPWRLAR